MAASRRSHASARSSATRVAGAPPAKGVVLAGGMARRLGGAKAPAELGGRPLIGYPIGALRAAGIESVVVAKRRTQLPALTVPIWLEPDDPGGPLFHPLRGVLLALRRAGGRPIVVLGCDMPFVTASLAAHLATLDVPLAVPCLGGRLEPLAARYDASLIPALETALAAREPVREAVAKLDPVVVDENELGRFGDPHRLLMNVNTPAELARAEALLSGRA